MTEQEKQELKNELRKDIVNELKAGSTSVQELEEVQALDNVESLPAVRGGEMVKVPISLLGKPAADAAALALEAKKQADDAAINADAASKNAATNAKKAQDAATNAATAITEITTAKEAALQVVERYEGVALKAYKGATARFDGMLEDVEIAQLSANEVAAVYYVTSKRIFVGKFAGQYVSNWSGADFYMSEDRTTIRKDKLFLLDSTLYAWNEKAAGLIEVCGAGGGNTINVTQAYPLSSGYYTLATAIVAVEGKRRVKGCCLTFEINQGKWVTKQFVGTDLSSWEQIESWEDFGGQGMVKSVTVNGKKMIPNSQGDVQVKLDEVKVDESLDADSTNPVANRAVAGRFNEIEAATLFDSDVTEEEGKQTVILKNKSGAAITRFTLSAGSGGGGETAATKIVLGASVDRNVIKEGSNCILTYSYDHQYMGGEDYGKSTGQKAAVEVRLVRGSMLVQERSFDNVSRGSYTLDLSKYLQMGTTDIYVKATTTDPDTGKSQVKQAYVNVKVVNIVLQSSYVLAEGLADGGYGETDNAVIPYTVQGTGTKTVFLYVDGRQCENRVVTRSGTTNGSFSIPMHGLAVGRHSVQLVAEMETGGGQPLRSESVYMDIFKAGNDQVLIGTKHVFRDGRILTDNHLMPLLKVGQYEQLSFEYAVFDAAATPVGVTILLNDAASQSVNVPRTVQTYINRFTSQGMQQMKIVCGATEYHLGIEVEKSGIDISEAAHGLKLKLSAAGRSNGEADPAHWEYGSVKTTFDGVDWNTSGWTGDALKLINGAKARIDFAPFTIDAATTGCTIEVEMKVSNITDKDLGVVSCMSGTKGFQITADKAMMYTGSTKEVVDEEGGKTIQRVGVGRQYGSDMWVKIAFVVGKRTDGRLMELYVNGTRSAADIFGESDNFAQDSPQGITIDSDGADVEIRNLRVYGRALSDDEEMDNYIIDRRTPDEMAVLFEKNDVLGEDGRSTDFEKLRKKGKGVMLVVRPDGLSPVNAENNKKADFLSDVHLWMPDGRYIYLKNVYIRIQGTSSTKYPTKNYRIYCAKGESPEMYVDGVKQDELKVALRTGQKAVKILCAKADYSDSSMTQNTGGARLWNDMMKALGFLTPPQQVDSSVRTAVDGFPIDVFSAESRESTPTYYGQYNLNHDKSDWQDITGLSGVPGLDVQKTMALEFLNNTQPLCLFQGKVNLDMQAAAEFDKALEFNFPEGTKWANATEEQKTAFKRLWAWIRDCVPAGAAPNNINAFVSSKFKSELGQYIDKNFLLCWWLFTDFFANVDQRAKNMIWVTWDKLLWFLFYYDGDTQQGDRNDSMLAYLYNVTRETWDAEKSKYAFEGHDSWLWCLVLANLKDDIVKMAGKMRSFLTEKRVNEIFDREQQGNWCGRIYNKSGELKYIKPQIEGVMVKGQLVKYPYIYALKGDKQAFRHWFIKNRFSLLDAKYETGNFLSDNIDMYMSRKTDAPANTIVVTASDLYYFGYGTNNAPHLQASRRAEKGEKVTLTFTNAFTVNDPIRIYGASRIAELDMRGASDNLTGDVNLNKCKVLRKIDLQTDGTGSKGWCLVLDRCRQLVDINLYGQGGAKTGTLSSRELDFSNQTRLKKLDARGVDVNAVLLARGCPITELKLGGKIQTLRLEYLPELKDRELQLQNWETVKTLRFAACPKLSWQTILDRCVSVERVRIEGINIKDDGTLLNRFKKLKGIDAAGNAVDYCALLGTVRLTSYMEEEEYAAIRRCFPELNILQPEYSVVEFDTAVADPANITCHDTKSGYLYGNAYRPGGHVARVLADRHAYTGNLEAGVMKLRQLADDDFSKHVDGSPAKTDGSEGDVFIREPHYWYKGVNDQLKKKYYILYSSNPKCPSSVPVKTLTWENIADSNKREKKQITADYIRRGMIDFDSLPNGKIRERRNDQTESFFDVVRCEVRGMRKVRCPMWVHESYQVMMLFSDADGKILPSATFSSPITAPYFSRGQYVVFDVPEGAHWFWATICRNLSSYSLETLNIEKPFDKIILSPSDSILDVEPDWVEHTETLVGAYPASFPDRVLRSVAGRTALLEQNKAVYLAAAAERGLTIMDYEAYKDIANLVLAAIGHRNTKLHFGQGRATILTKSGTTDQLGMGSTSGENGTDLAVTLTTAYGNTIRTVQETSRIMGYESLASAFFFILNNASRRSDPYSDLRVAVTFLKSALPPFEERKLSLIPGSDAYVSVAAVYGQRFADIVQTGTPSGFGDTATLTTYYCAQQTSHTGASLVNSGHPNGSTGHLLGLCGRGDESHKVMLGVRLMYRGKMEYVK